MLFTKSLSVALGCLTLFAFVSNSAQAQGRGPICFPPNNLHLVDHLDQGNINEQQFNNIIDSVTKYYEPIVRAHGANLKVNKLWTNSTVNASAQQSGSSWILNMYGGLARRPEITPDGFALVVCHELGHHLAGYAYYDDNDWAASEGQSDYFATHACAKAIWGKNARQRMASARHRAFAPTLVQETCNKTYEGQAERDLCYRSADGGYSLANLLATLGNSPSPKFETPDPSKVPRTNPNHPRAQCRLDTYFQGALCTRAFDPRVIPARNPNGGQDTVAAEQIAAKTSCMASDSYKVGYRPACWFKPIGGKRYF